MEKLIRTSVQLVFSKARRIVKMGPLLRSTLIASSNLQFWDYPYSLFLFVTHKMLFYCIVKQTILAVIDSYTSQAVSISWAYNENQLSPFFLKMRFLNH